MKGMHCNKSAERAAEKRQKKQCRLTDTEFSVYRLFLVDSEYSKCYYIDYDQPYVKIFHCGVPFSCIFRLLYQESLIKAYSLSRLRRQLPRRRSPIVPLKSKGQAIWVKKTFSLSDSVCLYKNTKELSCANLDEEFVFFGCRRMLIRQSRKNGLFAKGASSTSISPFPSYAKRSERHRYHRTYQAFLSCC